MRWSINTGLLTVLHAKPELVKKEFLTWHLHRNSENVIYEENKKITLTNYSVSHTSGLMLNTRCMFNQSQ